MNLLNHSMTKTTGLSTAVIPALEYTIATGMQLGTSQSCL